MRRQSSRKKRMVRRATKWSVLALVYVLLLIPMMTAGLMAYTDWVRDNDGYTIWVRDADDLKSMKWNSSVSGKVLFVWSDANHTKWVEAQTVSFGNATNLGYHTINVSADGFETLTVSDSALLIGLNVSTHTLIAHDSRGMILDIRSGDSTSKQKMRPSAFEADGQLSSVMDVMTLQVSDEFAIAENFSSSVYVNFSLLSVLTAEDTFGGDSNTTVYCNLTDSSSEYLEDGVKIEFRLRIFEPSGLGGLTYMAIYDGTLMIFGLAMLITAVFMSPNVDIEKHGLGDVWKSGKNARRGRRGGGERRSGGRQRKASGGRSNKQREGRSRGRY